MAGLTNISAESEDDRDIITRLSAEDILTSGASRENIAGQIDAIIDATKATKTYVDTQDSLYAPVAYYSTQDGLLVPNAAKGAAGGVASLGADSKVPAAQVPAMGAGILKGPWGPNAAYGVTVTTTPAKIAQWNLGTGMQGQPIIFLSTSVQSTDGRPVIEVRIGDTTQTTYAAQTLIAQGVGKSHYNDYQIITVISATALTGEGQDGIQDAFSPATNLLVNAWLYDETGESTTSGTSIATAALYFARTAL